MQNVLGCINLVLGERADRAEELRLCHHRGPGQRAGGGASTGKSGDQLPGWRDIVNPEHRKYIAGVWGVDEKEIPGPGVDAYELFRKIDRGEIKGLISICFNPKISLPDSSFVQRCLEKLEFYVAIDFFLNDTAWHADIVLPGSLHEEDEGTVTQVEGAGNQDQQGRRLSGRGEAGLGHPSGHRPRRWGGRTGSSLSRPRRSSRNCAWRAAAAWPITRASPTGR